MRGEAVLQAVHAAGILGDIAANGAGDLAGGIRCVVEITRRDRLADRKIGHATLGDDTAIRVIDLQICD